jgi:serine phosphatase RsbU (regulator of sigma subunit)
MMPALDEAEIGGDFFDVFSVDKEQYALVIGDVSGKGLKAAAQLAVVRNSLRTLIYLSHSPARAAETINAIMTVHGLLNGFVTLFVGVYDTGTGRLNYTSCGHEPGMVKRTSDGTVEMLVSAGIPLGVLENADYIESSITLNRGDTLLLYTDGISESGASRLEMLGSQGLMRVFESVPDTEKAESMLSTIVDKAQRNARSSFRDDVCILLLQRQRSGVQI